MVSFEDLRGQRTELYAQWETKPEIPTDFLELRPKMLAIIFLSEVS